MPGARVSLDAENPDRAWRSADIRVAYSGRHLGDLRGMLRPFVLLEVGSARVTPSVPCAMTSFVHDELAAQGQLGSFADNRPKAVRCVHPIVTLLEKLDALHRRVPNENVEPASFVRHFEDAARVINAHSSLPPLSEYEDARALATDMLRQRQIAVTPTAGDAAFALASGARTEAVRAAHAAIGPMFWGPRFSPEESCAFIRAWIERNLSS